MQVRAFVFDDESMTVDLIRGVCDRQTLERMTMAREDDISRPAQLTLHAENPERERLPRTHYRDWELSLLREEIRKYESQVTLSPIRNSMRVHTPSARELVNE